MQLMSEEIKGTITRLPDGSYKLELIVDCKMLDYENSQNPDISLNIVIEGGIGFSHRGEIKYNEFAWELKGESELKLEVLDTPERKARRAEEQQSYDESQKEYEATWKAKRDERAAGLESWRKAKREEWSKRNA